MKVLYFILQIFLVFLMQYFLIALNHFTVISFICLSESHSSLRTIVILLAAIILFKYTGSFFLF